jgi:hypothetical protein
VVTVIVSLFIFLFWNALENKKAENSGDGKKRRLGFFKRDDVN